MHAVLSCLEWGLRMARPRGDGIRRVRKTLADGSVVEYSYHRRYPTDPPVRPTTLRELIAEYKGTPEFRALKPGTTKLYRRVLDQIIDRHGAKPLHMIRPPDIQRERNALQDQPSKANMTLAMWSVVLGYGHRMGYVAGNAAAKPGRLPQPKRERVWDASEERAALAAFRPSLQFAFLLLLYTLQRPSDVLAMTKGQVSECDGRLFIGLRQQKTGALVDVPVHSRLEPPLRARLADSAGGLLLVPSPTGMPWSRRNFSRAWDHDLARAGVSGAQRRDLRRTGIVRLAEAGATTPQIAAISGHSIDYCQRIIDTYLPRRTEVALGGIEAWERAGEARSRVVRLKQNG